MKKIMVTILVAIIIITGIVLIKKSSKNLDEVLAQFKSGIIQRYWITL